MIKKFYEKTGMYIDWDQLNTLPKIDTLIDIGVGSKGTKDLYDHFKDAKLILIDPLNEAKVYSKQLSRSRNVCFFQCAVGREDNLTKQMKLQKERELSSFLEISPINVKDDFDKIAEFKIKKLDTLISNFKNLGSIGIKIDTEGFELDVILGATETLKKSSFVIAEVRHNHESLKGIYKLHEFMTLMSNNKYVLTKIITTKPFIADLCFQPIRDIT